MTVRIVTDSACDLPAAVADELGIEIVPLTIRFGEEDLVDRVEVSTDEFWARCARSSTLPQTAAPSPARFEAAFRRQLERGADGLVCVTLSSELSATFQSALLAAKAVEADCDVPGGVHVVDSRSLTVGLGLIVVAAARAAAAGASPTDVVAVVESTSRRTHVWGALDTLDNLRKGGRIGGAQAMLASVLSIKPIIEVRDGRVEEGGRQRTRSKAIAHLVDKVRAAGPLQALGIAHGATKDVDDVVAKLRIVAPGVDIVVCDLGAVIGTHSGVGTTGIAWITAP